jgi:chemotaxis protein CheD
MKVGHDKDNLPSCWHEFNHINRYWDNKTGYATAKILPGEFYVTAHNEAITTVLGSCISACIRDVKAGLGGMNHFMLPQKSNPEVNAKQSNAARYGNFAMEQMINDILRNGGSKENLEFKIFGGGKVIKGMTDIGLRNILFVKEYIDVEGFKLVAEDVGDIYPRKVMFIPKTGKVLIKKLYNEHNATLESREHYYYNKISKQDFSGDVELFD